MVDKTASLDAITAVSSGADLEIAVRVYPDEPRARKEPKQQQAPKTFLVFDTETTTDATQKLTFGSYRFYEGERCVDEGLFYDDKLSPNKRLLLQGYVDTHPANVDVVGGVPLRLFRRRAFVEQVFYRAVYKARSMVVCFNQPFDISRLAVGCGMARLRQSKKARGQRRFDYEGGFSFALSQYLKGGKWIENRYRPRIRIKNIDSKRALKAFTIPEEVDEEDRIPDWATPEPDETYVFRGHFLDLRTLTFALTDRGYTLAQACEAFGVEHGKTAPVKHGDITPDYIDYNRRDVLATSELLFKVMEEFDRHPIDLQATRAYSPASIGKAYLRKMGIKPALERQPKFPKKHLGHAMVAFFGGRTECRIRRTPVPVVYLDFLSMYPTVNALMRIWKLVTASKIMARAATDEVKDLLERLTVDALFEPKTWEQLVGIARVELVNDILPARAPYDREAKGWQIGINELQAGNQRDPLWFSIADVVASKILTGKTPKILEVIRFEPEGVQAGLKSVSLRGAVSTDPRSHDFFKTCIEERKRCDRRDDLSKNERGRLDRFLKILANATSYGITAEIIRHELPGKRKETAALYGLLDSPFYARATAIEEPGEFCFPPFAACITGAARLLLALLERCVTDSGGTFAMADTDSMAIVATREGGWVPCVGGPHRLVDGRSAIKALTWEETEQIRQRFAELNPYDQNMVDGSILDLEKENFEFGTKKRRQVWCYAISAKRYALYVLNGQKEPELLQAVLNNERDGWSEHGLGHLLNPTDPDNDDRDWIRQAWEGFIREAMSLPVKPEGWRNRPAVGRISLSSPLTYHAFDVINDDKAYADRIKPFNFILSAYVAPFGHPEEADPQRFHLVAPYNPDPRQWLKMRWIDMYSRKSLAINISTEHGGEVFARVKTYGEVLDDYKYHPEAKSLAPNGKPCGRNDVGLLKRRQLAPLWIRYIGKESNEIEAAATGRVHNVSDVQSEYVDSGRIYWFEVILPRLRRMPLNVLVETSGMSASALKAIRRDEDPVIPHRRNRERLTGIALTWEVRREG